MSSVFSLEVSGEFACFTRPEMKVERVSYDVITPSSARAVFESILWKPAISWRILKIEVLNPFKWISVRRNEVKSICPNITSKQLNAEDTKPVNIFIEEDRQQRAGLFLRDVKYRLHAELIFDQSKDPNGTIKKYMGMFERRAKKGQCFNQPYLGCREFSCDFRLIRDMAKEPPAISDSRQLGWMLYDLNYTDADNIRPSFFNAQLLDGVIEVPAKDGVEVIQ